MKSLLNECITTHSPTTLKQKQNIDIIRLYNNTERDKYKMKQAKQSEKKSSQSRKRQGGT